MNMSDTTFNQTNIELFKNGNASIRFKGHNRMSHSKWLDRVEKIAQAAGFKCKPDTSYTWKYVYMHAGEMYWSDTINCFHSNHQVNTHIEYKDYYENVDAPKQSITNYEIY
jgi:hypothetical protein